MPEKAESERERRGATMAVVDAQIDGVRIDHEGDDEPRLMRIDAHGTNRLNTGPMVLYAPYEDLAAFTTQIGQWVRIRIEVFPYER